MIKRYPTKQIFVGNVPIGGDAPIPVQSMTFTKTSDVKATVEQITALHFAGADIVRVAVPNMEAALALKEIKSQVDLPLVADIHFHYKLALIAAEVVDCIRINPGNIGDKKRVQEVVKACQERNIPIRIGVNSGSLEKQFEDKYGQTPQGMVASADYNIKYLEDLGFTNLKVSLKASDVQRTVEAYRTLRPMNNYPFHLGVTEAGTQFHSTIKSSIALGSLLLDGIGDTLRVSMTGELEEEIKVGKAILKDVGIAKEGLNIVSCPTCGRIEADLVSAVAEVERRTKHIKTPLDVSVMGCVVNAIGEAKSADVAIAFGKGSGLVMKKGEIIAKLSGDIGNLIAPFLALENETTIKLIGFIISLIGFWIIVYILGVVVSKIFSASGLGLFDRIFGFIFGAAKVFLIFSVIAYSLYQVQSFKKAIDEKSAGSIVMPHLISVGSYIIKLDTSSITDSIGNTVDKVVDTAKNATDTQKTSEKLEETIENTTNEVKKSVESTVNDVKKAVEEEVVQKVEEQFKNTKNATEEQIDTVKNKLQDIVNKSEENK